MSVLGAIADWQRPVTFRAKLRRVVGRPSWLKLGIAGPADDAELRPETKT